MQSLRNKTNQELVVKKEGIINLIFVIPAIALFAIALFFSKSTKFFFRENLLITLLFAIVILVALVIVIRKKVVSIKIVINSDGIWTTKSKLLKWDDIQYYYFEKTNSDGMIVSSLNIKLLNAEKEIAINISFVNKSLEEINCAIKENSKAYNLLELREYY